MLISMNGGKYARILIDVLRGCNALPIRLVGLLSQVLLELLRVVKSEGEIAILIVTYGIEESR
jgi:hypothetical protein